MDRSSDSEKLGTSIIPMAVPHEAQPTYQNTAEFKFPKEIYKFKEYLAMAVAREFGLMPNCDIRSPDLEDRMV